MAACLSASLAIGILGTATGSVDGAEGAGIDAEGSWLPWVGGGVSGASESIWEASVSLSLDGGVSASSTSPPPTIYRGARYFFNAADLDMFDLCNMRVVYSTI